jgi:hypothetical protein
MKPYLAQYLRSRDLYAYECFLRDLSRASGAREWIVRTTVQIFIRQLTQQFPSLTEGELRGVAHDRVAGLQHIPEEYMPRPDPADPDEQYDDE